MLVPRFSTRAVLIVTALCAVLFLLVGLGMRGSLWAAGAAVAGLSLICMAVVHAALFGLCYAVGRPTNRRQERGSLAEMPNASYTEHASDPSPSPGGPHTGESSHASVLLLLLLASAAMFLSTSAPLMAATGGVVTLPPAGVTPKSGLRITVDSSWVENYGYVPITVTVTSSKPVTADQTITFRFKASTWRLGRTNPVMSVDQDIELSEGDTSVTATVLVPRLQQWNDVWWDTLVDGSFEKELSLPTMGGGWFNQMNQGSGDTTPRILVVADDNQSVNVSTVVLGSNVYQPQGYAGGYPGGFAGVPVQQSAVPQLLSGSAMASVGIGNMNFAAQRKVSDLPTQWLAYSALDYLVLTPPQLTQIQDENPDAWTAIGRWVRAGGNLWLHDVAANDDANVSGWDKLDEVLQRLAAILATNLRSVPAADDPPQWYAPFSAGHLNPGSVFTRESIAQKGTAPLADRDRFAWRPAGLGAVLVSQSSLAQLQSDEWVWLQNGEGRQLSWPLRHGNVPSQPNAEFANLLIPGVGLAPVTEFRILITLFVLLIGPVNYWFLKRSGRLHLLILTVPLAALLVTLALFGYAIVGDGFSAKLRAVSYTALDQRAGEATSWARLSYYAGLAPSGGLEFPTDTAVYPIHSTWANSNYYGGEVQTPPRAVQWADHQYLTEGWLASRTPTQYLTIAARPSDRKLAISSDKGVVRVKNELGAPIELLVLRDRDGRLYKGESIDVGSSKALTPIAQETVVAGRLRRIFSDREPAFPEAFQAEANRIRARYGTSSYDYYSSGFGMASTSRLMQRINSFTQPVDSRAPTEGGSGRSVNLENGTYVAITSRGVDLATGLDDPEEEASFHLVEGRW